MTGKNGGDLLPRIVTGVFGIPLLLWVVIQGGRLFPAAVAAGAVVMLWEYHRLLAVGGEPPTLTLLEVAGLGTAALVAYGGGFAAVAWVFGVLALELALALRRTPGSSLVRRGGALALGALYVGFPLGLAVRLWLNSVWWVVAGLVLVWADDVLAYAVGVNLGRHRLAPQVSPNKSVEGAVGGLVAAVVAGVALQGWLGLTWEKAALTGLLTALAAQVGDLVESALKREAGVKDSGWVLPGHGGLLDRFDSSLLAFPVLYLLLRLLG